MKKLAVILVSVVTGFTGIAPAQAFPSVPAVAKVQTTDAVVNAQFEGRRHWRGDRRWRGDRHWRGDRRWRSDRRWRDDRRWRYGRYHRHRRGSDFGAVIGGLAAGAIIGGALAQPRYAPAPRYYGGGNAHVQWCYSRYRSYRAFDNSFQPYNGPRRQCYSPYS
jgi:hypothetical protein